MASPEIEHLIQMREYHARELQRCDDALSLLKTIGQQLQRVQSITARVQQRASGEPRTPRLKGVLAGIVREHADYDAPKIAREIDRLHQIAIGAGHHVSRAAVSSAFYLVRRDRDRSGTVAAPPRSLPDQSREGSIAAFVQQHAHITPTRRRRDDIQRLMTLAQQHGLTPARKALETAWDRHKQHLAEKGALAKPHARGAVPGSKQQPHGMSKSQVQRQRTLAGDRPMDRIRTLFASVGDKALSREEIADQAKLSEVTRDVRYTQQTAAMALKTLLKRKEVRHTKDGYVAHKLQLPQPASSNGAQA